MMNELSSRLVKCFSAVFPHLAENEIVIATPSGVEGWDSLASITLVSVIEEEFAIQIDPEDIEHLVSFEMVLDYLKNKQPVAGQ
jgi:acyl carrier protein